MQKTYQKHTGNMQKTYGKLMWKQNKYILIYPDFSRFF